MNGSTKGGLRSESVRFPARSRLSSRAANVRVDLPSTSNATELSNCNPTATTRLSHFHSPAGTTTTSSEFRTTIEFLFPVGFFTCEKVQAPYQVLHSVGLG
ncbi:unnamed protein product [Strongylus vulgaris]|uniref:Uncharacterized protein n=1 Tax=Strongylus vulgaris TaxID=40348 RepID=A0A3P7M2Q4_STRVU|nr:unnamed protein product [Strongylus vulgaris]